MIVEGGRLWQPGSVARGKERYQKSYRWWQFLATSILTGQKPFPPGNDDDNHARIPNPRSDACVSVLSLTKDNVGHWRVCRPRNGRQSQAKRSESFRDGCKEQVGRRAMQNRLSKGQSAVLRKDVRWRSARCRSLKSENGNSSLGKQREEREESTLGKSETAGGMRKRRRKRKEENRMPFAHLGGGGGR